MMNLKSTLRVFGLSLLLVGTTAFACDPAVSVKCRDAYFNCLSKSGDTPAGYQKCQDAYYSCLRAGGCQG